MAYAPYSTLETWDYWDYARQMAGAQAVEHQIAIEIDDLMHSGNRQDILLAQELAAESGIALPTMVGLQPSNISLLGSIGRDAAFAASGGAIDRSMAVASQGGAAISDGDSGASSYTAASYSKAWDAWAVSGSTVSGTDLTITFSNPAFGKPITMARKDVAQVMKYVYEKYGPESDMAHKLGADEAKKLGKEVAATMIAGKKFAKDSVKKDFGMSPDDKGKFLDHLQGDKAAKIVEKLNAKPSEGVNISAENAAHHGASEAIRDAGEAALDRDRKTVENAKDYQSAENAAHHGLSEAVRDGGELHIGYAIASQAAVEARVSVTNHDAYAERRKDYAETHAQVSSFPEATLDHPPAPSPTPGVSHHFAALKGYGIHHALPVAANAPSPGQARAKEFHAHAM